MQNSQLSAGEELSYQSPFYDNSQQFYGAEAPTEPHLHQEVTTPNQSLVETKNQLSRQTTGTAGSELVKRQQPKVPEFVGSNLAVFVRSIVDLCVHLGCVQMLNAEWISQAMML